MAVTTPRKVRIESTSTSSSLTRLLAQSLAAKVTARAMVREWGQ